MDINAAYISAEPQIVGGRVGIVMGLFVFACVYIALLFQLGWIAGIAIGWLPSALAGWVTALGCDTAISHLLRVAPVPQSASSTEG
ncbi:hypothetical protein [Noviherbaspirillum sp. ST9]|uniref:hypothetical protein n=1 Tax=Noviherbaspirillum sp. ST9 TaxID=3401606 RepID=UPI003B5888DA